MLSHLVCRKCLYNVRNELTEEAFCIIGRSAHLLTDSLLYTLTLGRRTSEYFQVWFLSSLDQYISVCVDEHLVSQTEV